MRLFADGFGLSPLVLNGVEVGRIRREIFEGVAGLAEGVLNVGAFVESGVVQDDHGDGGKLRQEDVANPGEKDVRVDAGFEQADGDQPRADESADDVGSSFGVPVTCTATALPYGRITVTARHRPCKPALVDPDERSAGGFIRRATGLKGVPSSGVRARMPKRFFYTTRAASASAHSKLHSASRRVGPLARAGRRQGSPAGLALAPPRPACVAETLMACARPASASASRSLSPPQTAGPLGRSTAVPAPERPALYDENRLSQPFVKYNQNKFVLLYMN